MANRPKPLQLVLLLTIGVLSISSGSILVRWSQEAPSLSIAFYRMAWASLILTPFYVLRSGRRTKGPGEINAKGKSLIWGRFFWQSLAALALALHFAFWITSLRFTSVAVSVLLVNTAPVLVAVVSYFLFSERLTAAGFVGIATALVGAAVLVHQDMNRLGDWRGAVLALAGALMLGLYLVAGRQVQRTRSLLEYVYPTYVAAALLLLILAISSGARLAGFSSSTHLSLLLLGLLPQCLGHTSYNWALRFLPATIVSILVLAEPVFASLLAAWLLGEPLTWSLAIGGAGVAIGIVLVSGWGIRQERAEAGSRS